jgi:hypothetical protein
MTFFNRGNLYLAKRDYKHAIADFTEAIRLSPTFIAAIDNRRAAREATKDANGAGADKSEENRLGSTLPPAVSGTSEYCGLRESE